MTVTATQSGSTSGGIYLQVRLLLGAKPPAAENGAVAGVQSTTPNLSITPNASNSVLFCSMLSSNAATTAEAGETQLSTNAVGSLYFSFYQSTSTTTAGTPLLMGSSTGTGIAISNVEILNNGSGITVWSTQPSTATSANGTTVSTAGFSPPPGALLVAMVSSNGGSGTTDVTITDSMGLTWTCLQKENGGSHGCVGIWVAQMSDPLPALSYVKDFCARGNTANAQNANYQPTSRKSLIVCAGALYSSNNSVQSISSITDSAGNTWHYATSNNQLPAYAGQTVSGQYYTAFIGWTWQDVGVATSYQVNFSGSAYVNMDISEWSNVGSITSGAALAGTTGSTTLNGPTVSVTTGSMAIAVCETINGALTSSSCSGTDGTGAVLMPGQPVSNFIVFSGNQTGNVLQPANNPYGFTWANFGAAKDYGVAIIVLNPRGAPTGAMFKAAQLPGLS